MWKAQSDGRVFGAVVVGLALVGWATLTVVESGQGASGLSHHNVASGNFELGTALLKPAGLFMAGWLLMTVAMMLPTTLPLVVLFGRITARRAYRTWLLVLLLAGYLAIWMVFGAVAYASDLGIHRGVESNRWLHANTWVLVALPVFVAGVYQFTPLKHLCLDSCRSPYSFILGHWGGRNAALDSLRLGISHGIFCLGCCWTLMLLMLALGIGNFAWMLAVAVLMGVEKNFAWGSKLSSRLGVVLTTAAMMVFATNML